jgi:predicted nucleic acid-binding protein
VIYFDASVLLEIYLGQPRAVEARDLLRSPGPKVASWLLAVEVPVLLRRALAGGRRNQGLLNRALKRFDQDLEGVSLFEGLAGVAARVRVDPRLAHCRSLDAVHVGSALQIQEMAGHGVQLATFDERLARVAHAVGLTTFPAVVPR